MQSSKSRRALALAMLGAALLVLAGSALAAGKGTGSEKAKIDIKGGPSFKPNGYIKDSVHFVAGTTTVRSGGTITLTNASEDPHTLSLVKDSQLPRTIRQIENCSICGELSKAHGVNPEGPPPSGPPPIPLVNVGPAGFDEAGDSVFVGPHGPGGRVSFKVTAPAGTTLNFMCIIHPWMMGRILVK